jgi:adenylate kinase
MRVLVLLGPPGAGKGTQAKILAGELGLQHVASGDLFRAEIEAGSSLGRDAKTYLERGALVPDALTVRMIVERLSRPDAKVGVVLDGFPRTAPQAEALDRALSERGARVEHAIYLDVPSDELVRRLSSRWVCPKGHVYNSLAHPPKVPGICDADGSALVQRDDDRPEVVRERLTGQLAPLYEVVDHYRERGVLSVVDATQSIPGVTAEILRLLRVGSRAA